MTKLAPDVGFLAVDARGHGETTVKKECVEQETKNGVLDLELDKLGTDLEVAVELTREKLGWSEGTNFLLIGHSLGGAVVTHVAKNGRLGEKVLGFAVLDVVEGKLVSAFNICFTRRGADSNNVKFEEKPLKRETDGGEQAPRWKHSKVCNRTLPRDRIPSSPSNQV